MERLFLHLAATEKYYQVYTFENRGYNRKEAAFWNTPMNLGETARTELVGKPIDYYLDIWDEVRKETLRLLKTKDDKWFAKKNSSWFYEQSLGLVSCDGAPSKSYGSNTALATAR